MKIDTTAKLFDLDGKDMGSLRDAIRRVCEQDLRGDESLNGQAKFAIYELAKRSLSDSAEYSVEELATIKDRIGRAYPPAIVGPAFNLLDPKGA